MAAGNTEVPAVLVLRDKGFTVRCNLGFAPDAEQWIATKPDFEFAAGSPLELLGLVAVYEARGTEWRAPDDEIDAFLATYYPK
jgi:hypothetical protein